MNSRANLVLTTFLVVVFCLTAAMFITGIRPVYAQEPEPEGFVFSFASDAAYRRNQKLLLERLGNGKWKVPAEGETDFLSQVGGLDNSHEASGTPWGGACDVASWFCHVARQSGMECRATTQEHGPGPIRGVPERDLVTIWDEVGPDDQNMWLSSPNGTRNLRWKVEGNQVKIWVEPGQYLDSTFNRPAWVGLVILWAGVVLISLLITLALRGGKPILTQEDLNAAGIRVRHDEIGNTYLIGDWNMIVSSRSNEFQVRWILGAIALVAILLGVAYQLYIIPRVAQIQTTLEEIVRILIKASDLSKVLNQLGIQAEFIQLAVDQVKRLMTVFTLVDKVSLGMILVGSVIAVVAFVSRSRRDPARRFPWAFFFVGLPTAVIWLLYKDQPEKAFILKRMAVIANGAWLLAGVERFLRGVFDFSFGRQGKEFAHRVGDWVVGVTAWPVFVYLAVWLTTLAYLAVISTGEVPAKEPYVRLGAEAPEWRPVSLKWWNGSRFTLDIPRYIWEDIWAAGRQTGSNPAYLACLGSSESQTFWATGSTCSYAGACGPYQFMPGTWEIYRPWPGARKENWPDALFGAAKMDVDLEFDSQPSIEAHRARFTGTDGGAVWNRHSGQADYVWRCTQAVEKALTLGSDPGD